MRARVRARRAFLDLFTDLYWRLLAVVVTPAWRKIGWLISNLSPMFGKKRGKFSKKRGRFFGKRGSFLWEVRSEGPEGLKYCKRRCESAKASVGQKDEIKESFGQVEGKPYFCREQGSVA